MSIKPNHIRCFKDDTVMGDVKGHPGWIYCPLCGLATKKIGCDAGDVRRDFDEMRQENYDAERKAETPHVLYPNGDRAPLTRQDKHGGGGKSGRRQNKPGDDNPAPKWTLA